MEIAVVSGVTSGIGTLIARALQNAGMHVVALARDTEKARTLGFDDVEMFDAAEPQSVLQAAERIKRKHERLAVLFNNAGVFLKTKQTNQAGHEKTFMTNVVAYHATMRELGPLASKVVNTASTYAGGLDLNDVFFERRPYDGTSAYKASKEADRLLSWAWARRLQSVNAFSPGLISTGLYRENTGPLMGILAKLFGTSMARGVQSGVRLALEPHDTAKFFDRQKEVECKFRNRDREDAMFAKCEALL